MQYMIFFLIHHLLLTVCGGFRRPWLSKMAITLLNVLSCEAGLTHNDKNLSLPKDVLLLDKRIFFTLVMFNTLCGGAQPKWDGVHAGWRAHGSGSAAQQVVCREKAKCPKKDQGEAKRDEHADSLVVESALADHIERLPSVRGSAEKRSHKLPQRRQRNSAAATSGIKRPKIITKINRESIQSQRMLPDDLWVIQTGVSDWNKPLECGWCTGRWAQRDWETTWTAGSHQHI